MTHKERAFRYNHQLYLLPKSLFSFLKKKEQSRVIFDRTEYHFSFGRWTLPGFQKNPLGFKIEQLTKPEDEPLYILMFPEGYNILGTSIWSWDEDLIIYLSEIYLITGRLAGPFEKTLLNDLITYEYPSNN